MSNLFGQDNLFGEGEFQNTLAFDIFAAGDAKVEDVEEYTHICPEINCGDAFKTEDDLAWHTSVVHCECEPDDGKHRYWCPENN